MKIRLLLRLKEGVLDSPGRALVERLRNRGFNEVQEVNIGKLIELELEGGDRDTAAMRVKQMCAQVLVNATIEDYEIFEER